MSNWAGSNLYCSRAGETKVLYYIDDDDKPFLVKLPIPIEQVTLGDFKRTLTRTNFKYFFRAKDPEVGDVKEEVSDDAQRVPACGGRIVVYMVSVEGSVKSDGCSQDSGSTKSTRVLLSPRKSVENGKKNGFATVGKERVARIPPTQRREPCSSSNANQNRGYETDSMVSVDCRSSYSDSEFDGSSRISTLTENTSASRAQRGFRKKKRKLRPSPMNRASSMSSITETTVGDNIIRVNLNVEVGKFLGVRIIGPTVENEIEGVYVDSIIGGSVVDVDGRIKPGDSILQVNGIPFSNLSYDQAVQVLKEAAASGGHISMLVEKRHISSPTETMYTFQEPDDNPTRKELAQPIDPSAWVAHIEAMRLSDSTSCSRGLTPLLPSYDGSVFRQPEYFSNMSTPVPPVELSTGSEPMEMIRMMAKKNSGLDIKDRMWLKIPIPNAFMGKDLIKWLYDHVTDLKDRSDAKKFASQLLTSGYIRHTIGTRKFSEQSYYTFLEHNTQPDELPGMSLLPDDEYPDTLSQLAAYSDLPDSVSQVGVNRPPPAPYRPFSNGNHHALSNGVHHASNGGLHAPTTSRAGGSGNGSSGGSGYGSDGRKKAVIYEETDSQVTAMGPHHPPSYGGGGGFGQSGFRI